MTDDKTAPNKPSLGDEVRIANEVLSQLRAAGITEEDPDFKELFASETDLNTRLMSMARVVRRKQAMADAMKAIIEEDKARMERHLKAVETIKKKIAWAYQESGQTKPLETAAVTISMRKGGKKVVGSADASSLPERFRRVKIEADKEEIKKALEANETVEGFSLANSEPSLLLTFN